MYFWTVRLHTRRPSFNNSPRILSAPQSRLFIAISRIKAIVSSAILGLREAAFDFRFQYKRKSSRCHLRSVSGCTIKRAGFQVRTSFASRTRSIRSALVTGGLFTRRLRIISCWRKRAFSAISSDLLRPRSAMVCSDKEEMCGFVQRARASGECM